VEWISKVVVVGRNAPSSVTHGGAHTRVPTCSSPGGTSHRLPTYLHRTLVVVVVEEMEVREGLPIHNARIPVGTWLSYPATCAHRHTCVSL
jgi:hypothetical protein